MKIPEDEDEVAKVVIEITCNPSLQNQLHLGSELIRQEFSTEVFIERVRDIAAL